MKTETQIAKENVEGYIYLKEQYKISSGKITITKDITTNKYNKSIGRCETHLASCQRFLEFLRITQARVILNAYIKSDVQDKITDLQNTIKIYEDGGVK